MGTISRSAFIQQSLKLGAFISIGTLGSWKIITAAPTKRKKKFELKNDLFQRLITANDKHVEKIIETGTDQLKFSRRTGSDIAVLSASYCSPDSKYYHNASIVSILEIIIRFLSGFQSEDGTVNIANIESPPDTAFLLESLTAGAFLLLKDHSPELSNVNSTLKNCILKAGDALVTGGVHTPNHRWVICAALARIHTLYPAQKYLARIEDWLGEGIFNDSNGHYPERSMNYAKVENNSLITLGRLLHKPELFEPVIKNLEMVYYYMEPNGDLVTNDSRRQDQYQTISIIDFYLLYRYMAIKNNNALFAGITTIMEKMAGFEEKIINNGLFHFMENSRLQNELPAGITPPDNYEKLFSTSHLLHLRRGNTSTTFFGGVDWPLIIASGRSDSPDFYAYRKGEAILKYMRLSVDFFRLGYFYSSGLKKENNKYVLYKKWEIPYYQPLPKNFRNKKGDYKLSPSIDDRFWNKMDFKNRPVSNIKTLETRVTLTEKNGGNELYFEVTGQAGIEVTIELCFKKGGKLSGVTAAEDGNSFLETGTGKYEFGGDTISFGPGTVAHKNITALEGERYSTHFGNLRTEGMHVYLTGVTPFTHKLTFN